jgi:hypothetical protein
MNNLVHSEATPLSDELILPSIFLIQPKAKLLSASIKEGMIVESIDTKNIATAYDRGTSLAEELYKFSFVPLSFWREWRLYNGNKKETHYNPEFEPRELIWATRDQNDPRIAEAGGEKIARRCYIFIGLVPGVEVPVKMPLKGCNAYAGKILLNLIARKSALLKVPMYDQCYDIKVVENLTCQEPHLRLMPEYTGAPSKEEKERVAQWRELVGSAKTDITEDCPY